MKKYNVILYIITALAVALNIVMVTILPDTVALHWGIDGKPDAYGSKYVYLLYAAIPLLAAIVLPLIKMKDKDEKQKAVYMKTLIFIQVLFIAIFGVCYYSVFTSLDSEIIIDISKPLLVVLGIFFIVIGNMMPKVRKNHTLGLRCYWSLYNDVTWQKSQRFSAYSIMVFGALLVASGIIFGEIVNMIVMLSSVFIFLIANLIAAHSYYKQEKQKELN